MDYCPDSWDEPTFTGLAAGCPEVCRLHRKELVKRVAFEGTTPAVASTCVLCKGYVSNNDEWPQPMKNTLLKLWGMYHDMHNALLDEKIENGKLVKDLNEEKIKVEKKYSSLMADVSKFMNDTERQVMLANYDKIVNGSEEEKLREIKTKLENELMKANDEVAMLKEGKIADDRKMKVMKDEWEKETLMLKEEKKKLEYQLYDMFNLSSARNNKLVKIKQICDQLCIRSRSRSRWILAICKLSSNNLAGGALGAAGAALAGAEALEAASAALALAGAGGALAGAGAGGALAGAGGALAGAGGALAGAVGGAAAVLADAEVLPSSVCLVLYVSIQIYK
ncbi:hypothetical protein ACQ4PT_017363 [Festuca glaucescens]